jgi:hypothetical protein
VILIIRIDFVPEIIDHELPTIITNLRDVIRQHYPHYRHLYIEPVNHNALK